MTSGNVNCKCWLGFETFENLCDQEKTEKGKTAEKKAQLLQIRKTANSVSILQPFGWRPHVMAAFAGYIQVKEKPRNI